MKHRWTLLLLGASFFVLLTSMKTPASQPDPTYLKVEIAPKEGLRVALTAQNDTGKKLYLSVLMLETGAYNQLSETEIYAEVISGDISNITRTLNLSKLGAGTYQIKVKAGRQRFEQVLNINSKPVEEDLRVISFN